MLLNICDFHAVWLVEGRLCFYDRKRNYIYLSTVKRYDFWK